LNFKRTHRRDYTDGFLSANTLRELCFYNKVRELSGNCQRLNRYAESIPEVYQTKGWTEAGQNFNKRSIEGQQIFILESKQKANKRRTEIRQKFNRNSTGKEQRSKLKKKV